MQRMIHADLVKAQRERRSIVVIDSQGDLINKLMRLAVFDPEATDSLADGLIIIDCGFRRYRPPFPINHRPLGPTIIRPPSPIIDRPCCRHPSGSYFTVFGIDVVVKRRGLARASFAGSRRIIRGGRRCEERGRESRPPEWDWRRVARIAIIRPSVSGPKSAPHRRKRSGDHSA
jgi:hypothetical protein